MNDRAHIRKGKVVKMYRGERGTLLLENGDTVSPVVLGWVSTNGNEKVVPVIERESHENLEPNPIRENGEWVVNPDEVRRVIRYRDRTPEELDQVVQAKKQKKLSVLEDDENLQIMKAMYQIVSTDSRIPAQAKTSEKAFFDWVASL